VPPSLLPKDFNVETATAGPSESTTRKRIVLSFPSRPGGKVERTTKKYKVPSAPELVKVTIKPFGSRVKATTEFAGWPSPPTTTTRSTTTTTTTPAPTVPTTPGVCGANCRLAATLKITGGRPWTNTLLDPHTQDWQNLADRVTQELTVLYRNSELGNSFNRVEVEAFSPGSIIVDYYIVFDKLPAGITTRKLKTIVNKMVENNGDNSVGEFTIDPSYSDFIVVGAELSEPATGPEEDEMLLPQWAIAVVVIGLASLAFVIIFGASMLAKRRKVSRSKKAGMSLTEEMVYELNRSGSHGYGLDGGYNYGNESFMNMESWKMDKAGNQRFKRGSSSSSGPASSTPGPYQSNMYDSWKTEWNPHYRDYQTTHYPQPTSSYMTKGGRRPSYDDDF